MEPKVKIKMVNVEAIITALEDLYAKGVNFVDILQEEDKDDTIIFSFSKDYIDEKYLKNFEGVPFEREEKKLTKEGLDELLS